MQLPVFFRVRFAHEVVLAGQMAHDGAALAQLRLTVNEIRQIREVQA